MSVPFFFVDSLDAGHARVELGEDASRHAAQVLRLKPGDEVELVNGKGLRASGQIESAHKKLCTILVLESVQQPAPSVELVMGISLLKNISRFEWFLEKATEIGVRRIVPLVCSRTESTRFRADRLHNILVSALLQSQQTWLPELQDPQPLVQWINRTLPAPARLFIAHCENSPKTDLATYTATNEKWIELLIGPEGDFSREEIELATNRGYQAVSLGETRLRTETAGMVAISLLQAGIRKANRPGDC